MARKLRSVRKRTKRTRAQNPKYETLRDLLFLKLHSLYDIEREVVKAMPAAIKAATNEKLREALAHHLEETHEQVARLETIFAEMQIGAKTERVDGVRGLTQDLAWIIRSVKSPAARDALLIAAMQYIEHYEMAGYGTARTWARLVGEDKIADGLQQSLDEEGEADKELTLIAEREINEAARSSA